MTFVHLAFCINIDEEEDSDSSNHSIYIPSDYSGNFYNTSGEFGSKCGEQFVVNPSSRIRFDNEAHIPDFCFGMSFESIVEFKQVVIKYSVVEDKKLRLKKNDSKRVRFVYVNKCPFVLFTSKEKSDVSLTIRTFKPKHTCCRGDNKNKLVRSFVAKHFREVIMSEPRIKLAMLKGLCRKLLKVELNISVCRNVKKKKKC